MIHRFFIPALLLGAMQFAGAIAALLISDDGENPPKTDASRFAILRATLTAFNQ